MKFIKYYTEEFLYEDDAIHIKNNIFLSNGVDKKFFDLLYELYHPFLGRYHLSDKYQYSIFQDTSLVGIIQISSKPAHFIQIAFIPSFINNNMAESIIDTLIKKLNYKNIGWSANKENYPSLKLLYNLNGGIMPGSLKNKKYEGRFFSDRKINTKEHENLESILIKSKELFLKWKYEFDNRKDIKKKLEIYLSKIKIDKK